MTKRLRAFTIIPPELYVSRDADRQLRRVLEDMGRPGYILVARQMGKTNLLLNAKRTLETPDDAFVYADLSNSFSTARDCFRNIVDTAIDSHPGHFGALRSTISKIRGQQLLGHKEHELELRELLRAVKGKLVVSLDEIDALTTSTFSDQIFSQIRSTYFSRANFAEFNRLTYVLSGVAEPSELIKNPKLSPFNIGEKIYLDDFTETEFGEFIEKAGLRLPNDVRARLLYWINGNPRMTWDLCSEIEDVVAEDVVLSSSVVDEAVAKLYLTSFDRPPIDHIRTLSEASPEIRASLVELRYGKGASLSDVSRGKLYLAGIVSSRRESTSIKNRVIEASLSEQWLLDVDRRQLGLLATATSRIRERRYLDAVDLLVEIPQGFSVCGGTDRGI